jgi:asparagine synthase (glutamine-hydrolysing)
MCGFVGIVALSGANTDPSVIQQMSAVLRHRGPDDEGIYISGAVGFGFRRLSILDLSPAGHQPMFSRDGQTVIVFNGEIYNYLELRQELEDLGHTFDSSGDTEVLLHAYLEWGRDCVQKLNGMWAFLIYDMQQSKIFGSRDRFGKKPLYRYRSDDLIFFASEIKAILASGYYRGGTNWNIVSKFLLYGDLSQSEQNQQTFYTAIEQVPAGSAFEVDLQGQYHEWRFWSLADLSSLNIMNPIQSFSEIFEDAVRLRLRSDVPVGIFLSGGLDSTSILCTWTKISDDIFDKSVNPLLAFSYQAKEYDESIYIMDTIAQTGAQLIPFTPEPCKLWNTLEQFIWYQDEPVHSIPAVITFELSRMAASYGVKVILNGSGPDEFLAGYHHYFTNYWYSLFREGRTREVWQEICSYCFAHDENPWTSLSKSLYYQLRAKIDRVSACRKLLRLKHWRRLRKHPWFTPALSEHLQIEDDECIELDLNSVLKRSVERAPLPLYLRIEDRNSMAHSIEARMPFLDYRLVSLAFQLPVNWKMRGPWNKYVLRQAMYQRIPESVRNRLDKMGFPTPIRDWFANDLYEPMQDLLGSQAVRERGIYNLAKIQNDLKQHKQGKINVTDQLFNLAQFEIWCSVQKAYFARERGDTP